MRREKIDWIHPSYRDLVIEELSGDTGLQHEFLRKMSFLGVKLAISDSGGPTGSRNFPLMTSPASWQLLQRRCMELVAEGDKGDLSDLLNALHSAIQQAPEEKNRDNLTSIITPVCRAVREKWNKPDTALTASQLEIYSQASLLVSPLPPLPNLDRSWGETEREMREELNENEKWKYVEEHYRLQNMVELATVIHENEPRFLRQIKFPETYIPEIKRLLDLAESDAQGDIILDSPEDMFSEAERLNSLAKILTSLASLAPEYRDQLQELADELQHKASVLEENAHDLEDSEPEEDSARTGRSLAEFSIEDLFSDL